MVWYMQTNQSDVPFQQKERNIISRDTKNIFDKIDIICVIKILSNNRDKRTMPRDSFI